MNHRPLWLVLWITALLWFGALWLSGQTVSISGLRLFAEIPAVILAIVGLFDGWAWRWPIVRQLIAQLPDARGTWRGQLITTWTPPDGREVPPITVYLIVRQTYFSIWARLLSEQSSSETIAARLVKAADGVMTMTAVYRNVPRMAMRTTSPISYGAFIVELAGDPVTHIQGHYWTDRKSGGDMEFSEHSLKLAVGFKQAASLNFSA